MLLRLATVMIIGSMGACGGGGGGGPRGMGDSYRVNRMDVTPTGGSAYYHVYNYDANGQQSSTQRLDGGIVTGTTTYTYSGGRKVSSSTTGTGAVNTTYVYDAAGRIRRFEYDYDKNGTVDAAVSYAFDAHGYRSHFYNDVDGDGDVDEELVFANSYDTSGRLVSRQAIDPATSSVVGSLEYTYDADGRPATIQGLNAIGAVTTRSDYTWEAGDGNWFVHSLM